MNWYCPLAPSGWATPFPVTPPSKCPVSEVVSKVPVRKLAHLHYTSPISACCRLAYPTSPVAHAKCGSKAHESARLPSCRFAHNGEVVWRACECMNVCLGNLCTSTSFLLYVMYAMLWPLHSHLGVAQTALAHMMGGCNTRITVPPCPKWFTAPCMQKGIPAFTTCALSTQQKRWTHKMIGACLQRTACSREQGDVDDHDGGRRDEGGLRRSEVLRV